MDIGILLISLYKKNRISNKINYRYLVAKCTTVINGIIVVINMGCNPSKDGDSSGGIVKAGDGVNAAAATTTAAAADKLSSSRSAETLFIPLSDGKAIG